MDTWAPGPKDTVLWLTPSLQALETQSLIRALCSASRQPGPDEGLSVLMTQAWTEC